ncbi:MAG TPA: hypothetical protein VFF63_07940 [Candidatus Babeliales bacterium]|nr:hypothetical protein [Candidatus Babeliales bacterium]
MQPLLLALQAFQVAFLWTHDWIPLGPLNDVAAVRKQDPLRIRILVTLMQSVPFTVGLVFSARYFREAYPSWLIYYLWISYGLLFIGELQAWWIPYLLKPDPARAARYTAMYGRTHAFLPQRNGLVPNTAHVLLHVATLATLVVLALGGGAEAF